MMKTTQTQPTTDQKITKMLSQLKHVAWMSEVATEKCTPFVQADFELLRATLSKALRAIEDCGGTK